MFVCPTCQLSCKRLIAMPKAEKLKCENCHDIVVSRSPHLLEKSGSWGNMSYGKAWEIDNRVQSKDDPKVYINRKTGKETQY